jgi:hypothetical protein
VPEESFRTNEYRIQMSGNNTQKKSRLTPEERVGAPKIVTTEGTPIRPDGILGGIHAIAAILLRDAALMPIWGAQNVGGADWVVGMVIEQHASLVDMHGLPMVDDVMMLVPLFVTVAAPGAGVPFPAVTYRSGKAVWESQGTLVSSAEILFLGDRLPSMEQARRRLAPLRSVLGDDPTVQQLLSQPDLLTPGSVRASSELPYLKMLLNVLSDYAKEVGNMLFGAPAGAAVANGVAVGSFTVYNPRTTSPLKTPALAEATVVANELMHSANFNQATHELLSCLTRPSPREFVSYTIGAGGAAVAGVQIPAGIVFQSVFNYVVVPQTMSVLCFADVETYNLYDLGFPAAGVLAGARESVSVAFPLPPGAGAPPMAFHGRTSFSMSAMLVFGLLKHLADSRTESSGLMRATYSLSNSVGIVWNARAGAFGAVTGGEGVSKVCPAYVDVFGSCRPLTSTPSGAIDCLTRDADLLYNLSIRELASSLLIGGIAWDLARKTAQQAYGLNGTIKAFPGWGQRYGMLLRRMQPNQPYGTVPMLLSTAQAMLVLFGVPSPRCWIISDVDLPAATPYATRPVAMASHLCYGVTFRIVLDVLVTIPTFCPLMLDGDSIAFDQHVSTLNAVGGAQPRILYDIRNTVQAQYNPRSPVADGLSSYVLASAAALSVVSGMAAPGLPALHLHTYTLEPTTNSATVPWTVVGGPVPLTVAEFNGTFLHEGLFGTRSVGGAALLVIPSATRNAYESHHYRDARASGMLTRNVLRVGNNMPMSVALGVEEEGLDWSQLPGAGEFDSGFGARAPAAGIHMQLVAAREQRRGLDKLEMVIEELAKMTIAYHERVLSKARALTNARGEPLLPLDTMAYAKQLEAEAELMAKGKLDKEKSVAGSTEQARSANTGMQSAATATMAQVDLAGRHEDPNSAGLGNAGPPAHVESTGRG